MTDDITTKQVAGILVVLVLIKFIVHFISLQSAPLLPGFDGGYYAVQVREIILSGMLYYSAPPISFYIFAFFAQILLLLHYGSLPVCIITGIKLGLSVFVALTAIPAYYLGRDIFRKNYSGVILALLILWHPYFIMISTQASLYKNAVGVFFLLVYLCLFYRSVNSNKIMNHLLVTISFILDAMTHVLTFGVALGITMASLAVYFIIWLKNRNEFKINKKFVFTTLLNFGLVGVLLVAILVFAPQYFGTYYKFEYLFTEVTLEFIPGILRFLIFGFDFLSFISLATLLYSVYSAYKSRKVLNSLINNHLCMFSIAIASMCAILAFLLLPIFPHQMIVRLIFMSFVPFSVLFLYMISKLKAPTQLMSLILIFLIFFPGIMMHYTHMRPVVSPDDVHDILEMRKIIVPENSIVYAPFGVHYWVTWFINVKTDYALTFEDIKSALNTYQHVYIIADRRVKIPNADLLYTGRRLFLYELRHDVEIKWYFGKCFLNQTKIEGN